MTLKTTSEISKSTGLTRRQAQRIRAKGTDDSRAMAPESPPAPPSEEAICRAELVAAYHDLSGASTRLKATLYRYASAEFPKTHLLPQGWEILRAGQKEIDETINRMGAPLGYRM